MVVPVLIVVVLLLAVLAVSLCLGAGLLVSAPRGARGSGKERAVDRGLGFVLLQASLAGLVLVLPAGVVYRRWAETGSPEAPLVAAALCLSALGGGLLYVLIVLRRLRKGSGGSKDAGGAIGDG
jgi:hypothetical protein